MSAAYYPQVQEIYVAYYGRPADPAGLQYWAGQLAANKGNLSAIINAFGNSSESTALYAGASNSAKVTAIYQQIFNRAPDSAGLTFYTNALTAGTMTAASIALNVADGASGVDATYLANKLVVAQAFSDALTTDSAANLAYSGTTAITAARSLITGVTTSAATTNVASTITSIKAGGGGSTAGQTFTLTTTAAETVVGTANSDKVGALFTNSATTNAVQVTDSITDSFTNDSDTLTFDLAGDLFSAATASATPTVRNIENIVFNINTSSANLATDATYDNAATKLYVDGTTITGAKSYSFNVVKAQSGVTGASLKAATADATVTTDARLSSLDVGVATAGDNINITMNGAGVPGTPATATVRNAAGDVTASGAGDFSLTAATATGAVNATAAKNLTVSAAAAGVVQATTTGGTANVTATAATLINVNASSDVTLTDSGAGSINIKSGGTITTAGTQLATSMTLSGVGAGTLAANNAVTSLTLSGNGASATFNRGSNTSLANIQVTGDKNVTLTGSGATLPTTVTVTDTGTGTFTLRLNGAATAHDFSGGLIDVLRFDTDQGGVVTTVKTGQAITYTLDQGALSITGKPSATNTLNAVTLILNDGVRDAAAVDINTSLTLTDIKTATIDATTDVSASGGANTFTLTAIDGSDEKADVTINGGINNITLAGTHTVGATGTVVINTSGAIALGAAALTASKFDASASTGEVTGTGLSNATVRAIYTGSGSDTLTLAGAGNADIKTNAGTDTVTLAGATYSGNAVSIDLGDGTDTLVMQSGTKLITGSAGSVALAGVETIRILAAGVTGTDQISASVLSGKTYNINASAAGATGTLDVIVLSNDSTVDLSTLNGSIASDSTIEGMTFVIDDSANADAITIKGMVNGRNTIAGSSAADNLTGGALNDTFQYSTASRLYSSTAIVDTITGGAGSADTISLTATAASFTITAATDWTKVTGVERISTVANTGVISLTLGATAQAAGINRINLSANTDRATDDTVNVSAFTSGVSIVGSAGADVLTGGSGNDTFIASTAALLIADTIVGGDGTDTLLISDLATTPIPGNISDTQSFANISGVEVLSGVATSTATTYDLDSTIYAAGIRTVNLSMVTATTGNQIDVAELLDSAQGVTLIGSSTGATTLTGGSGNDTITGGSAGDTITGGAGNDVINAGDGANTITNTGANGSDSITTGSGADTITLGTGSATVVAGGGVDTITAGTGGATITGGTGADAIALDAAATATQTIVFGASASANGVDTVTIFTDSATVTGGGIHKLDFTAFLGSGYSIVGNNGVSSAVTKVANTGTADVNIAGKVVVLDATALLATLTTTQIFNLIDGAGDAFAMASGKSVVIADNSVDTQIFYIDAALDGVSGVSVSDIVIVGSFTAATGQTYVLEMFGT